MIVAGVSPAMSTTRGIGVTLPSRAVGAPDAGGAELVLAVDLGTSGCKCALVTLAGAVEAWAYRAVPLHIDGTSAEQDPADWWQAFLDAATQLLRHDPAARRRIVAVCCSTQGEGTVAVDRAGAPLGRAMVWLDMRGAAAIARRMRGRFVNVAGYAPGRLWRLLRLTGGAPALSGKDPAGHMAYLQDQDPARYERTYKFLNVLDYLNLRLTGRFCATHDSILTSWVTDNRRVLDVRYDERLIAMLGISADKLPQIVASTEVLGPLLPEVARLLELDARTPVVAGAIDNSAVAVGTCAVRDFETHLYLGTSSWLGAHLPAMKTDIRNKIAAVPCAIPGRYLAVAMQSAAGANLSFLRDRILFHPDGLMRDEQRPDVYQALDRIAQGVPPGARGLIYTPWLFGERTPVDDTCLRAGLLNLSLAHTREDIIRAFLEGVALNTRWMLEPFVRFTGRRPDAITAVGGAAQSDVWCQILADVTGYPIRQPEAAIQANARGAAYIAGVGIGALRFDELPQLQRTHRLYEPAAAHRALYDTRYGTFRELHRRLAPLYRRINRAAEAVA
jgi:xylulokinase